MELVFVVGCPGQCNKQKQTGTARGGINSSATTRGDVECGRRMSRENAVAPTGG